MLQSLRRRLRGECRTEERLILQSIEFRIRHGFMLNEDFERGAHPVWFQQLNRCCELRAILVQPCEHLLDPEPHEKTHLVGEAGRLETLFFTGSRQTRKIHMGGHVLLAHVQERILMNRVLPVAEECSTCSVEGV